MSKNFEIIDKIGAMPRTDFRNDRLNASTECPMFENVIAYAFKELGSDAISEVENHLASCRVCTVLAEDVRSAADESQQQDSQPVEVLPAVARAINRSRKPLPIKMMRVLIPNFSIPAIYPKIAAAVATACLVLANTSMVIFRLKKKQ